MANKRRSKDELAKIDALLERLREFIRLNYMTAAEVARQIGVRDTTTMIGFWVGPDPRNLSASPHF
jgi:hypothetical protein